MLLVAAYWRTNLTMRQLALLFGMSRNHRYATNHQVVIDADSRLVVVVGRPLPGNRNDCKAWQLSGAKDAVGKTTVIADGGYRGTGLVIPHRRERGRTELPARKEEHNASHCKVRARVEHAFARMKDWKILRDCRRAGIPCEDQETEPPDGGAACADHWCFAISGGPQVGGGTGGERWFRREGCAESRGEPAPFRSVSPRSSAVLYFLLRVKSLVTADFFLIFTVATVGWKPSLATMTVSGLLRTSSHRAYPPWVSVVSV